MYGVVGFPLLTTEVSPFHTTIHKWGKIGDKIVGGFKNKTPLLFLPEEGHLGSLRDAEDIFKFEHPFIRLSVHSSIRPSGSPSIRNT